MRCTIHPDYVQNYFIHIIYKLILCGQEKKFRKTLIAGTSFLTNASQKRSNKYQNPTLRVFRSC